MYKKVDGMIEVAHRISLNLFGRYFFNFHKRNVPKYFDVLKMVRKRKTKFPSMNVQMLIYMCNYNVSQRRNLLLE